MGGKIAQTCLPSSLLFSYLPALRVLVISKKCKKQRACMCFFSPPCSNLFLYMWMICLKLHIVFISVVILARKEVGNPQSCHKCVQNLSENNQNSLRFVPNKGGATQILFPWGVIPYREVWSKINISF